MSLSGGSQLVIGLSNTICCLSETLMFFFVFPILEKTGCLLFMVVGFFGYTIRFCVVAVMENPWILLPFEVLQGTYCPFLLKQNSGVMISSLK